MAELKDIVRQFGIDVPQDAIRPLGSGLINDTYLVVTPSATQPDYVLQRINHNIFRDVEVLQHNIEVVTEHLRAKLAAAGVADLERRALRFIRVPATGKTYAEVDGEYWRMSVFIPDSTTVEAVTPATAEITGKAFGEFQAMLADVAEPLGETIPDFHNMEFRLQQFREAIEADAAGRLAQVRPLVDDLLSRAEAMTEAERLYRAGKLPKRICHCDTKVNNILFDREGNILCVIDLDTVMPSFIFSDFGDFLRTAANTGAEDASDLSTVDFDMDIFRAFARGYLSTATFLTDTERAMLPYAALLFPYMQAVRFLTDYLNGDTYYKIECPEHNLVRTRAQMRLLERAEACCPAMEAFIKCEK